MNFNEYQEAAMETAIYGSGDKVTYPILGLLGEAGEIANKYKKVLRDNGGILTEEVKEALLAEVGDVLWYLTAITSDLGETLDSVAVANIAKLKKRRALGTINGSGDSR